MNYKVNISTTKLFDKSLKRLSKKHRSLKNDYAKLLDEIESNPEKGTDLGDGLRKIRMAIKSKGRGKSSGARVVTYTDVVISIQQKNVYLLTIYDKSEIDNVSKAELLEMIENI